MQNRNIAIVIAKVTESCGLFSVEDWQSELPHSSYQQFDILSIRGPSRHSVRWPEGQGEFNCTEFLTMSLITWICYRTFSFETNANYLHWRICKNCQYVLFLKTLPSSDLVRKFGSKTSLFGWSGWWSRRLSGPSPRGWNGCHWLPWRTNTDVWLSDWYVLSIKSENF